MSWIKLAAEGNQYVVLLSVWSFYLALSTLGLHCLRPLTVTTQTTISCRTVYSCLIGWTTISTCHSNVYNLKICLVFFTIELLVSNIFSSSIIFLSKATELESHSLNTICQEYQMSRRSRIWHLLGDGEGNDV